MPKLTHTGAQLDEAIRKVLANYADVSGVTASAGDVRSSKKIVTANKTLVSGSMPEYSGSHIILNPSLQTYTIPAGYHDGTEVVSYSNVELTYDLVVNQEHSTVVVTRDGVIVPPGVGALHYGDELTINATADVGYTLTVITVNGNVISSGGVYYVTGATVITVTASAVTTYPITLSLSHCTASGTDLDHILAGEEKSITITADAGYSLPDSVTVTGCQSLWVKATGELVLSNPTGAVTVTCAAERLIMPTPQNLAVGLTDFGGYIYALSCDPVTNAVNYEVAWSTTPTGTKESMGAGAWSGTGRPQFNVGTLSAGTYYMFVRAKGVGSYADSEWSNYVVLTLYGITVDSDTSHTIRDMTDDYGTELTTNVVMANHALKVTALPATGMVVDTENSSVAMAGEAQPRAFVNNVVEISTVTGAITVMLYSIQAPKLTAPVISLSGDILTWSAVPNASSYKLYADDTDKGTVTSGVDLTTLQLATGSHSIQVMAVGSSYYTDSDKSNSVSYTVLPQLNTPANLTADGTTIEFDGVEGAEEYEVFANGISIGEFEGIGGYTITVTDFYEYYSGDEVYVTLGDGTTVVIDESTTTVEHVVSIDSTNDPGFSIKANGSKITLPYILTEDVSLEIIFSCLTGDTNITMADGSIKCLKDIDIGDCVLSYRWDDMKLVPNKIIFTDKDENKYFTEYDKWTFSDGSVIKTVHRHEFYNVEAGRFKYMDEWKIGEHAYKLDGTTPELLSHETVVETVQHYKITGELGTNYFANGLLTGDRYCPKNIKLGE